MTSRRSNDEETQACVVPVQLSSRPREEAHATIIASIAIGPTAVDEWCPETEADSRESRERPLGALTVAERVSPIKGTERAR